MYKKDLESVGKAFHHLGQSLEDEVACLPKVCTLTSSVPDPDPNPDPDPPDPHVFGPPGSGSGSISQRNGSGSGSGSVSFYHQAKKSKKTLIPTALGLPFDFLSLKMMYKYLQKVINKKTFKKL